jgi:methionyl-tRNA formyltransferase
VDTSAWKRELAQRLADAGLDISVLYSRSGLADQVRAGVREFGLGSVLQKYATLTRRRGGPAEPTLGALAEERGLSVIRAARLADPDALAALRRLAPDVLVLAGADIVPASVLEVPRVGTLNAHYGLLPAYRGMNVTEWSLYHGDPVGVTVHMVDAGIDTGDIVLREEIPVEPGDTLESLRAKLQSVAARLLFEAVTALLDGTAAREPQRPEDGHQYYRMHPALRAQVERRLESVSR